MIPPVKDSPRAQATAQAKKIISMIQAADLTPAELRLIHDAINALVTGQGHSPEPQGAVGVEAMEKRLSDRTLEQFRQDGLLGTHFEHVDVAARAAADWCELRARGYPVSMDQTRFVELSLRRQQNLEELER